MMLPKVTRKVRQLKSMIQMNQLASYAKWTQANVKLAYGTLPNTAIELNETAGGW